MLSRQFLRAIERADSFGKELAEIHDGTRDMIEANRDCILQKHEEAFTLIKNALDKALADKSGMRFGMEYQCKRMAAILHALGMFHPMHGESWTGWPKEDTSIGLTST